MNVTEQITRGTIEVPAAGGNVTVEIEVTNNAKGAPMQVDATFKRKTEKPYDAMYLGSAMVDAKGTVDFHLNHLAQLSDGLKGSLLAAVLKEAAEAFNLEAAEAAE